jgi:hypothetical protein
MNCNKIDRVLFYAIITTTMLIILGVIFLLIPRHPLIIHNYEVYNDISPNKDGVLKEYTIKAGEDIEFDIVFSKFMDVQCEVTVLLKQVDNGYLYPFDNLPRRLTRMPVVRNSHYKDSINIPISTPQGKYVFIRSYTCPINFLNTFEIKKVSNEFYVEGRIKTQSELIKEGNKLAKDTVNKLNRIEKKMKK